jgi:hypothetical protein
LIFNLNIRVGFRQAHPDQTLGQFGVLDAISQSRRPEILALPYVRRKAPGGGVPEQAVQRGQHSLGRFPLSALPSPECPYTHPNVSCGPPHIDPCSATLGQ